MSKKIIFIALFSLLILSFGGCKPMSKSIKAIEGKDGLFAIMETSNGDIVLELYYKETPLTVTNFVGLAEGTLDAAKGKPFYNGLKFHRVISVANGDGQDFMIQGGDPKGNGTGGPGYKFADEIVDSLTFSKSGVLAMANSGSDTNGSQFFITIAPTTWLNGKHTIFGKVVDGQKVVNTMKQGATINAVTIVRNGAEAKAFKATQADFNKLEKDASAKKVEQFNKQVESFAPNATKTADGIFFTTKTEGSGNKCGKGKKVAVHYTGYLMDGTVFDSSISRGETLDFNTGAGQMISGFDVMVQDMKVGEKRTFVLPPEMAYGSRGAGGVIPGGAYIVFDVQLISAK